MDKDNFCGRVVTIPQFTGTCWFNSILMSLLYSQNSRKLLLHDNIYKRDKTNAFYKIINKILENKYLSREKGMKYFNIMRPENILRSFVENKDYLYEILDGGEQFYSFLPIFIEYLGKTCITLDKSNFVNGEYYVNLVKSLAKKDSKLHEFIENKMEKNIEEFVAEILKPEITNPDYILVNIPNETKDYMYYFDSMLLNVKKLLIKYSKTINYKKHTIRTFDDIITYNGDKYILDSSLIINYNAKDKLTHAIAGIKCKNQKYVYNGWVRTTIDPSKADDDLFKYKILPCELMKYNWDVNDKEKNFCLNPQRCNVDIIKNTKDDTLCFSFSKGFRTLVYVKMNDEYKSVDSNLRGSSNISEKPKTPPKKDVIVSKLFKRPLTSKDCYDWNQNKKENPLNPKNPITGHRLTSKSPIYKELDKICVVSANEEPKPKTPPKKDAIVSKLFKRPLTSKDCYDWKQNKQENPLNPKNPITGHRLKDTSPIYKELNKICDTTTQEDKPKPKTPPKKDVIDKPKTPPKNDAIVSKLFKRPLTSKDCFDWNQNKKENPLNPKNPITGHRLKDVSPIYKELNKICDTKPQEPKPKKDIIIDIPKLTSKECYDWNKNKHINPITGKRLLETDPLYKELDKICNFCNKVVTIPQYLGTCWFNAMLMSILYSQYSRKLLLHDNIYANEKTNKLYKIINRILTKTYISKERALKYFNVMRPEKILENFMNSTKFMEKFHIENGNNYSTHLPNFIKSLGKTSITLDIDRDGSYYLNFLKIFNMFKIQSDYDNVEFAKQILLNFNSTYKKLLEEIKQENPDYIFVNLNEDKKNAVNIILSADIISNPYYYNIANPINKFLKISGLHTHDNIIHFNGDTYILDSCLLSDYKNTYGGHAIAGITCKNKRYVYNGWIRTTIDAGIVNKHLFKDTPMPCELMKYDWDVNKDEEFCLNSKMCRLDKATKDDDLCFSFGKTNGHKTLVYVKMNEKYKSIDSDISKSSS
jgi:hypothetical protein